jgi:prepilin-type N-terminal cleavage/methylation domain-containing protein
VLFLYQEVVMFLKMRKGFTLVEIIITIVIIGVLATLALPRLGAQVITSEAAEAFQFFGEIKRAVMSCYDAMGNFSVCTTQALTGVTVPGSTKFDYFQSAPTSADTRVTFWARSVSTTANYILMEIDQNGITRMASPAASPYVGVVLKTGTTTADAAVQLNAF